MKMKCPRCHNQKVDQFYKINNQYYCRKCIQFSRVFVNDKQNYQLPQFLKKPIKYHLDFELSPKQKDISKGLKENYILHQNSLVQAVCGSGKTEIVFELLSYSLSRGERVCYCTPRKELCKELYERIVKHFINIDISLVYGGHIQDLESQFIICTTHQLYRFEKTGFHLIILDEADAFPFYNNKVLEEIFLRCVKGNYVKLSATISQEVIDKEKVFIMNRRYHNHELPLPYIRVSPLFLSILYLIWFIKHYKKKTLIYVPTIEDGEKLFSLLKFLHFQIELVHSKCSNNHHKIQKLREGYVRIIITTSLLERGITIQDVQVIVFKADHMIFDSRTLIQIAGRVGRSPQFYNGKICFLGQSYTKEMKRCIYTIRKLNSMSA